MSVKLKHQHPPGHTPGMQLTPSPYRGGREFDNQSLPGGEEFDSHA